MQSETKSAIVSAALHAGVLGFAMLTFSGAALDATPPESMPIDLVSTEEFSKLAKGAKDAPKAETPKPLVEKKAEEAKPVEEQKPKPVEKKPEVQAARAETAPPAEQKPDPIAEKIKKEEPKQEAKPVEKKVELPPRKPPPPKPQPKFDADKIAALLDKREATRETSTGAQVNDKPSLGATQGAEARLSQSEIDALRARLRECWNPPVGAVNAANTSVVFRVLFRKDGALAGAPALVEIKGAGSEHGPVLVESARRALLQCQPYKMLKPEHYDMWKDMEITFDPRDMFRG
jgi:colicin import membrane protein